MVSSQDIHGLDPVVLSSQRSSSIFWSTTIQTTWCLQGNTPLIIPHMPSQPPIDDKVRSSQLWSHLHHQGLKLPYVFIEGLVSTSTTFSMKPIQNLEEHKEVCQVFLSLTICANMCGWYTQKGIFRVRWMIYFHERRQFSEIIQGGWRIKVVINKSCSASEVSVLWVQLCLSMEVWQRFFCPCTFSNFLVTSTTLFVWLFVAWAACISRVALSCSELHCSCCTDLEQLMSP